MQNGEHIIQTVLKMDKIENNVQEILKFGLEVFNNEETKFNHWLETVNISLGNKTPNSLLYSDKGCKEVLHCLNRIEYGNFC